MGAGIAGLAIAEEALRRGHEVLVLEKSSIWGGLTRSFEMHGCLLDFGPHLLLLRDPEVMARVRELVDETQWVKVVRGGKLYIEGRHVDWPLRLQSVLQFPFSLTFQVLVDQLLKRGKKIAISSTTSYEEELLAVYGKSLYQCLFGPLTQKFLKESPRRIHKDWAYASIRAATKIADSAFLRDNRFVTEKDTPSSRQEFNLLHYVSKALRIDLKTEDFYYFKDGFGALPNAFARSVRMRGGEIRLGAAIKRLFVENNQVTHCLVGEKKELCDVLVWTGTLHVLAEMLAIPFPPLNYLHTKLVYVFLKACPMSFQSCYYADPSVPFNRSTILSNHSRTIIRNPVYTDVLCLEYSYRSIEEMLAHRPEASSETIRELQRVKLIRGATDIVDWHCENVPCTYPILDLFYKNKLEELRRGLAVYRNVYTVGRQGSFSYDNSDLVIKESLHHPLFEEISVSGFQPADVK